jgi:hypothetical protein
MVPGPASPGLLVLFGLISLCATAAAVGVWLDRPWAAGVVIALGVAIATTSVVEGFVLGMIPYLRVVAVVVGALAVTFVVAAYLNNQPNPWVATPRARQLRGRRQAGPAANRRALTGRAL